MIPPPSRIGDRRRFLVASGSALVSSLVAVGTASAIETAPRSFSAKNIKALVFDTVGTLVDSYGTVAVLGAQITRARGIDADWSSLYTEWNAEWRRQLDDIIAGKSPWRSSDVLYRNALDHVLAGYSWGDKVTTADRLRLNELWYKLRPWSDTKPGLERLRRSYTLATLSNASMASLIAFIKQDALPVDCILSAELVRSGKPDPRVYELAAQTLNLQPDQILMVAAHKYDLAAARRFGFHVAFVPRPFENGPNGKYDGTPETFYDLVAPDMMKLADALYLSSR